MKWDTLKVQLQLTLSPTRECVEQVPELVRVGVEVGEGDHAGDVLAVEVVVGGVDVARAPVRVVVAVGARAEGPVLPQRRCRPVTVVMAGERTKKERCNVYTRKTPT